jgi:FSR family fosmidomycin resistance protein-like MFS transporter
MRRIYLAMLGILTVRGFMTAALVTYLPVFISRKGTGLWFAGISLSVLEAAGTGGTVAAGPLSDLVGRRAVLLAAMVMSPILMLVFLSLDGGWLRWASSSSRSTR